MTTGEAVRKQRGPRGGQKALLHVNLPANLVKAVRALAEEERRSITAQVTLLLEESEELQEYIKNTPDL